MYKAKVQIGKNAVEATFEKASDVHKFYATYGSLPTKCDACGSDNIYLSFKSPKDNDYYMVECGSCHATANFGIYKDGKGLFWKGEKMAVYAGNSDQQQSAPQQNADFAAGAFTNEEVPF